MIDAAGTTSYTYTNVDQILTEDGPFASDTVTNSYVNRLRTSLAVQQPLGLWTNKFVYDAAGRLTNVTSPAGVFGYTLGGSGLASPLIKKLLLPNTSYITNTFDAVARLTGTWLNTSGNITLDSAVYGYNLASQRAAFTNAAGTYVSYVYDRIGQLKVADSSVNTEDRGYLYDAAWNLSQRTNNGSLSLALTVDNKNQLSSDGTYTYTYDGNGNLVALYNGYPQVMGYNYDDENRLTGITYNDPSQPTSAWWQTVLKYDGLGRLRERDEYTWLDGYGWYPNSTTDYIYDGMRVIQERGNSTVSYTRGTDLSGTLEGAGGIGGLLARSSGSTHLYYHADGNGNITYLVNSSQGLAASYRYDPFGNTISWSGTFASANVYRFSSKEIHLNSGMYYYGLRFYSPNLQRWLNRDPLGEPGFEFIRHAANGNVGRVHLSVGAEAIVGPNLYYFVGNKPLSYTDPLGLAGYGNPVFGPNGPVGPSDPYAPGWPYYPNGPYYKPGPPLIDPACFSDCMKTWLGGNCLNYAIGVAGAGAVSAAGSMPVWYAGIQLPAYWVGGYSLGLYAGSSTVATVAIGAGAGVVWGGGILAAAGLGWGVGTVIQCLAHCSQ